VWFPETITYDIDEEHQGASEGRTEPMLWSRSGMEAGTNVVPSRQWPHYEVGVYFEGKTVLVF
jgi:hypothetical protein